jgi:nucleotide-binding universal stress UspA family protein/nitroimidazol reductase NimA-like FMN-containing flavoprotein (pyridoxamine 5'-phosphate oxidase superfamily)
VPEEPTESQAPRIVVGVSSSPASRHALAWAAREAATRGEVLHAVFAWQYPFELADGTYVPPMPNSELEEWAVTVLDDEIAAVHPPAGLTIVREARSGPAAAILMDAAEGASLLVVGSRGHGRITGLLLGSVSQFLAVHAPCPVVVVHDQREDEEELEPQAAAPEPAGPVERGRMAATAELGVLEEIGEEECLGLLAGASVGRLVVVRQGQPLAFPMNYVLDGRTVAVRTDPGTKLDAATLGRVAFEVDAIDAVTHQGWSVLVQGVGRDVTDAVDAWSERVRESGVEPWAEGEKQHWIAIAPSAITGRRIRRR